MPNRIIWCDNIPYEVLTPKYRDGDKVITPEGKGKIIESHYTVTVEPGKQKGQFSYIVRHSLFKKRKYMEDEIWKKET